MSAIWGRINWDGMVSDEAKEKMEIPYRTRCKIERFRDVSLEDSFFCCGIQHVTNEAKKEVLPIYDKLNNVVFDADCILDNREEVINELLLNKEFRLPENIQLSTETFSNISQLPDGSLLYLAYTSYGIDFLKHIRGLFAISIYDIKKRTLFLAADQVSSRCLYYFEDDTHVTFSTLLDPLKMTGHNEINETYMKDFLCAPGLVPNLVADETSVKNVFKVLPGRYLSISRDKCEEKVYWKLHDKKDYKNVNPESINSSRPEKEYAEMRGLKKAEDFSDYFNKIYTEAVRDAIRTTDNVAISMSSGYDSASVGAIAADLLAEKNEKLYTYTYVTYEEPVDEHIKGFIYDETENVKEIANMHPNMLPHFLNNGGKNCYEKMDDYLEFMEIPYKAFINLPNLCEVYENASKDSCRIVLNGQNGNFTVSHGYIHVILYDLYCKKDFYHFFKYLNNYCLHEKISRKQAFVRYLLNCQYFQRESRKGESELPIANPFIKDSILNNYNFKERFGCTRADFMAEYINEDLYHNYYLDCPACYTYFGEFDTKLSLKYGIVLRDPTKDIRVLSFCNFVPHQFFGYNGVPRFFIYSTMKNRLPDSMLEKWERYGVQNSDWLNRVNRDFNSVHHLLSSFFSSGTAAEFIDSAKINEWIQDLSAPLTFENNDQFIYLSIVYICKKYMAKETKSNNFD